MFASPQAHRPLARAKWVGSAELDWPAGSLCTWPWAPSSPPLSSSAGRPCRSRRQWSGERMGQVNIWTRRLSWPSRWSGCPYRGPGSRLSILLRGSSRNILAPSGGFGQGFFCHWAKKGLFMLFCLDLGIFFVFSSKKQFKSLEKSKKSRETNKYLDFRKTKKFIKCHNSIKKN